MSNELANFDSIKKIGGGGGSDQISIFSAIEKKLSLQLLFTFVGYLSKKHESKYLDC